MMMTVNEVSKLAGVSIRTLQYYDKIGLLHPTGYTDAGYRLYDDADLERLQHILLFRELEFPLKDIKMIVNSPDFDRSKAFDVMFVKDTIISPVSLDIGDQSLVAVEFQIFIGHIGESTSLFHRIHKKSSCF